MNSPLIPAITVALVLAGCAAQNDGPGATLAPTPATQQSIAPASTAAITSGYKLTSAEEKLDCPRLVGQMKVRIASMRAMASDKGPTAISQTTQSIVVPVLGGSRRGADPVADRAMDLSRLEAFNRRLIEKKCKPLDLDAELRS